MSAAPAAKRARAPALDAAVSTLAVPGLGVPNGLFVLVSHAVAGLWTPEVLRTYALTVPVCLLALPVGAALAARMSRERFERFTLVVLLATGVLLLLD